MSKRIAFFIVHYGAEYFYAALKALAPQVDEFVILYTPTPSQGFASGGLPCPDDRFDLMECTREFEDKMTWVDGRWPDEGSHVNSIWDFIDADTEWLIRCDTDEIFPDGMVDAMIEAAKEFPDHKGFCVPFVHHWKSFSRVCKDQQMPVRMMRVSGKGGDQYLHKLRELELHVHHMGYAQDTKYIQYKLAVSGHHPEFRPEWYFEKWLANAQEDLHPVCKFGFWNAEDYDKTTLPAVLLEHANYDKDVI